jgi:hypothetical protein
MPKLDILISEWGKPGAPMNIVSDGETVPVELHPIASPALDRCADYAGKRLGTGNFHLGFYGYLRVCDSFCMQRAGVSIFDLADMTWRDHYDERVTPGEAVARALEAEGFTISEDEELE